MLPRHLRQTRARCLCSLAAAALVVSGCNATMPGSSSSPASDYATSCLTGAVLGAIVIAAIDRASGKSSSEQKQRLAKAAAGGCVVGLAATAIGRVMDERQRARHEEEMTKEARRRALEQQQYTATTQRLQAMPASTNTQRAKRDAELERARAAYETSIAKPVKVDLGGGGTSTIQVQAPAAPAATGAAGTEGAAGSCTDYSVLVQTPTGRARQFETWCPNSSGQMVRTDAREAPAA